ncbi:MAG TPA: hypothetical protein VKT80_15560, partial [Chloroflexota bacterium]|nr:hypothetical protein [Chloroflexota bacterium]
AQDRYGNPVGQTVSWAVSGPATLSGSTVTATGYGTIKVQASIHDSVADTLTIGVVPRGTVAGLTTIDHNDEIIGFNLDGSHGTGFAFLSPGGTTHWAPNGASIVFDQGPLDIPQQIASVTPSGQVSILVDATGGTATGPLVASPIYSRDGSVIYYADYRVANSLWRVHPDGSGDSAVTMQVPEPVWSPSPSPDGTQIAYIATNYYGPSGTVKVLDVATGAATSLGVQATWISWSPNSDVIAYITPTYVLGLIHASGAGNTSLSTGVSGPFEWSPDGQWLIVNGPRVVNATTGAIIPVFYYSQSVQFGVTQQYEVFSPTWAPTPPTLQRVRPSQNRNIHITR